MAHCPSQDWDDYSAAQDEAAEAEIAWWQTYREYVLQITCALIANPSAANLVQPIKPQDFVDRAAEIVMEITKRSECL